MLLDDIHKAEDALRRLNSQRPLEGEVAFQAALVEENLNKLKAQYKAERDAESANKAKKALHRRRYKKKALEKYKSSSYDSRVLAELMSVNYAL